MARRVPGQYKDGTRRSLIYFDCKLCITTKPHTTDRTCSASPEHVVERLQLLATRDAKPRVWVRLLAVQELVVVSSLQHALGHVSCERGSMLEQQTLALGLDDLHALGF